MVSEFSELLSQRIYSLQARPEAGKIGKRERVGAIGESFRGIVVGLDKNTGDADGGGGAGKRFDELRLTARRAASQRPGAERCGLRRRRRDNRSQP